MTDLYLGLGSNLGDRERLLHRAVKILVERIGGLKSLSAFYETEPWGFCSDHPFLNAVAVLCTEKTPEEILRITQAAERELGGVVRVWAGRMSTDRLILTCCFMAMR